MLTNQPLTGLGIDEIIGDKREAILRLAAEYGASNVRVFGSVARGEARPDSDVDLLITFPENESIFELVGLWQDMQELIGRDVSLIADAIDDKRFLNRILKDAVPL
jgi:predicted nucleotidyltransferase